MSQLISIVTATRNAERELPGLIESLRQQTDRDFQWVVADGASTDGTLPLLQSIADLDIVISSQPDFGIYDALNRAIRLSSGGHYIVAGADDVFEPDAIANFRKVIDDTGADIVAADVLYGRKRMTVKRGPDWLFGQFSSIASHALATAFRKSLHERFGTYSNRFPIAADQFFVMKACRGGASSKPVGFVAGNLGCAGVSSLDRVGNATEVFRVQVALGGSLLVQVPLFLLRLLRVKLAQGGEDASR
jgi:glycosyltransferase involved in cell wall biosynthesis